ncbi:MAG: flagellar biosynthesis protein FlhA [Desulfobacterales bacterium]|nr:flagellar biosynthesis protein FlhA [Desulfobacterales bacterium]
MATTAQIILGNIRKESSEFGMVVAIIGMLMAMILPLGPFVMDFFLALNITMSVIVLITTVYTETPLQFSIFPSLLLVLTLFRLSLNVATTRLILLHGHEGELAAGSIIKSFGNFVVGGNYVVGMIIFIVLVLINFMVITKGSGRIAEVAARFTLDAMPGKQMAIDADLNAGLIDEDEAKRRRKQVGREAEFHGAMDGASKFVKGDAVAGIIITGINIIGGFIIGVLQQGMSLKEALANYTLLTVGDGLVSQIPALIISTAAGMLVSRAGSEDRMGKEFAKHIFSKPEPIYMGAVIIFFFGLIPGLPTIPFMSIGLFLAGSVFFAQKRHRDLLEKGTPPEEAEEPSEETGPEEIEQLLSLDIIELEVGYGLIPLVDKEQDGTLLGRIRSIRRQFATDMGLIIPPIHIRDNLKLNPSEYRVLIKGVEITKIELMLNHFLAMDPGDVGQKIDGIPTTEPAFNLPALWIPYEREEDAKFSGYTVVDNSTIIATHLTEIIKNNADQLLGRQEVQHLLDNIAKTSPKPVEELVPNLLSLGSVQKVLQNLLRERISIRDMLTIVETLADYAAMSKDPDLLTEYVRQKLARSILAPYVQPNRSLQVITLDRKLEELLQKSIQHTDHGSYLAIEPNLAENILVAIREQLGKVMAINIQPILLCSPVLRRHLRKLIESTSPTTLVISHAEILHNLNIQSVGKVALKYGG